jgi:hypothetical protein
MAVTVKARCYGCDAAYTDTVESSRRVAASKRNRQIWMDSHAAQTRHPRFAVSETTTADVICRIGPRSQLTLADDPRYSEIHVGHSS